MATRDLERMKHHLLICNGGSCMLSQGEEVTQAIREEIARCGADAFIHTTRTRCNGRCEDACVVIQYPEGVWYREVTPDIGRSLVKELIHTGRPLGRHILYSCKKDSPEAGKAAIGVSAANVKKKRGIEQ